MSGKWKPKGEGYYAAIIAGGGGPTILYYDGEVLLAHGTSMPIEPGYMEYIAEDPLDIMAISGTVFLAP